MADGARYPVVTEARRTNPDIYSASVLPTSRPTRLAVLAAALALALATVGWRLITFNGFTNDQYVHMALAQQLLLGDWPVRDFIDPGEPLMYLVSATAWRLWGDFAAVEWSTGVAGFAIGATCLLLASARLSGSVTLGVLVTTLVTLVSPRHYGYPKIVVYAAVGLAIVAVCRYPSRKRIAVLGALVAGAFLFRHDHGVYTGMAALAAVVLAGSRAGITTTHRLLTLTGAALLVLLPWLAFVVTNDPMAYARAAIEFARGESITILREWPQINRSQFGGVTAALLRDPASAAAALYWIYWLLPLLALIAAVHHRRTRSERWEGEAAAVAALVVMAAGVNAGFLRNVLAVRVADAAVPAALLGAFVLGLSWTRPWRRPGARVVVCAATILILGATAAAVRTIALEQFERAGLAPAPSVRAVRENVIRAASLLRRPHRELAPSRNSRALLPFFEYLDRCTSPTDRLVLNGLFPDILVLAGRGFAGGSIAITRGYAAADQAQTVERLRRDRPAFALLVGGSDADFRFRFDDVHRYLGAEYLTLSEWPVEESEPIRILVDRSRRPTGIDAATGFPCYKKGPQV